MKSAEMVKVLRQKVPVRKLHVLKQLGVERIGGRMKGASRFDCLCHRVFDAKGDGTDFLARDAGIACGNCGKPLRAYYCEERLYLVDRLVCGTRALTKANNAKTAALKTLAHRLEKEGVE